ncbi:MAG TPA: DUF2961 domain-containing protein [Draconibacterium sp.]|nr:DUF2961 domain-containing protein [Draconibacterium sp.]
MKQIFFIALILMFAGTLDAQENSLGASAEKITIKSLLLEMTDRANLAQWPDPEFRLMQASSYDRRSSEKNSEGWFANEDWSNYQRKEIHNGKEVYVLMDVEGPGVITRFWTGGHPNQKNNLKFYIDGREMPFWEADHTGALIGQNKLIGSPLSHRSVEMDSLNINKGAKPGHNLYAPIPFNKRIKITSDCAKDGSEKGFWYVINYRLYKGKVNVESFSKQATDNYAEELRNTNKQLNDFMELSALKARVSDEKEVKKKSFSLKSGASETIHIKEQGAIKRLFISLKSVDLNEAVKNTWLQIAFDRENTIDIPLGFFFGCGDQHVESKNWFSKVDKDGSMAGFWVMPFQKNSDIKLIYKGDNYVSGLIEVAIGDWLWNDRSMYFHSNFKRLNEMPANKNIDFSYIEINNKTGVYVGDILQINKNFRGWWGEGDEKVYVDGSKFPDHFGTGTEDYYGYAWGHPEIFNNIFTGQPIGNANTGNGGTSVNSRVRSLDAIPFNTSLRFDMESWQLYGGPVNYALACFWYEK